ncbi:tripartite tricarboxylate transporter TctB family protein [Acerihabitans arboris]|uniref:Tripartite tricarboxylate transporter TctB family protein n=1 Tax=Acerihabitans arboris TaxID=2691583 RepID=A0A845SA57_9GAMM|nr:tripartite tricarboxylate transporter TctB family protein [Acerihabitans arboris]NDL61663.1 tripartite tricarboxylate transporter TctB family protein [Acerihabitans arboris]
MDNFSSPASAAARRRGGSAIRNHQDFWSGWLFLFIGCGFSALAGQYPIGAASRMGAGFFPLCLGLLLAVFGLLVILSSLSRRGRADPMPSWKPGKLIWILGATTVFALLLEPAGLVISLLLLVFISSKASDRFTVKGTLANAAVLVTLNVTLFIWGLDQLIPVWPAFITH